VEELAPGLWRWTAFHADWKEEVGSVALETDAGLVFIDPLDPPAELGAPDHVLLTVYFHARASSTLGAPHVWAPGGSVRSLGNRGIVVTDPIGAGTELPGGIVAIEADRRPAEVVYLLAKQRAVVVGDVLLGAGAKPKATAEPLRLCPERWLGGSRTHEQLRESLRPLLGHRLERILVSHGAPVLERGEEELAAVLSPAGP
jgi:hypothetical protein